MRLSLHKLKLDAFELFHSITNGRMNLKVVDLIFEEAALTNTRHPEGHILESILTEFVLDDIAIDLYAKPKLLQKPAVDTWSSADGWTAALKFQMLKTPQMSVMLVEANLRASDRRGRKQSLKYYSSLQTHREKARVVKITQSTEHDMAEAPDVPSVPAVLNASNNTAKTDNTNVETNTSTETASTSSASSDIIATPEASEDESELSEAEATNQDSEIEDSDDSEGEEEDKEDTEAEEDDEDGKSDVHKMTLTHDREPKQHRH